MGCGGCFLAIGVDANTGVPSSDVSAATGVDVLTPGMDGCGVPGRRLFMCTPLTIFMQPSSNKTSYLSVNEQGGHKVRAHFHNESTTSHTVIEDFMYGAWKFTRIRPSGQALLAFLEFYSLDIFNRPQARAVHRYPFVVHTGNRTIILFGLSKPCTVIHGHLSSLLTLFPLPLYSVRNAPAPPSHRDPPP